MSLVDFCQVYELEEVLGPHDAMDGLRRRVPDGAAGKALLVRLRGALVALGLAFADDGDLPQIKRYDSQTGFQERNFNFCQHKIATSSQADQSDCFF